MKRVLALFTLIALLAVIVAFTVASSSTGAPSGGQEKFRRTHPDKKIANQYIVVLKDTVGDVDAEAVRLSRDYSGDRGGGHTYRRAIKGFSVRMTEPQATRLANDTRVAFVEEDGIVSIDTTQTGATWGLDRIDQQNDGPVNRSKNPSNQYANDHKQVAPV